MRRIHLMKYDKVSILVKKNKDGKEINKQDYGKVIWLEENKVVLDNGEKYNYCNVIEFKRRNA